jgi:dihydroorotase
LNPRFDLIVRNGICVMPGGTERADIGITQGRVAEIGSLADFDAEAELDAAGLHVIPGVIDAQVHCREPGFEHKETLATANRGAILGGVTSMLEMANTNPPTTTDDTLADKVARALPVAYCDMGFSIGATAENLGDLERLERLPGVCAIEIFMGSATGGLVLPDDTSIGRAMRNGGRRMAVHCIDEERVIERRRLLGEGASVTMHPIWRDEETSLGGLRRAVALARAANRPIHVLGISSAEEAEFILAHKDLVTVEVTPHHLVLEAPDCYERLGTFAQMNPPIRDSRHREALWRAVRAGLIDAVGTDHAPHAKNEKLVPYPSSASGLPGVQTLLPTLLDAVNGGRLSLERLVDLTSAGPARVYGIAGKGRIALGYDGDLTLVDLKARRQIETSWIANVAGWSPYDGTTVSGWPRATVVRGQMVMRDDEIIGQPQGRLLTFH